MVHRIRRFNGQERAAVPNRDREHDPVAARELRGPACPELSGPGVSVYKPRYNTIIWRAENRTHLSKQTRPSTERSRKASNVRGIPFRRDYPLRWVLIVRTQV